MYQYCGYGELPTDLNVQDDTIGPPPAFFRPSGVFFYGLGDAKTDKIKVDKLKKSKVVVKPPIPKPNPVKVIRRLKTNQEMPQSIPASASRYTEIDPLSPMFRSDIPKYGFGEISNKTSVIGAILVASIILAVYFLKFKH